MLRRRRGDKRTNYDYEEKKRANNQENGVLGEEGEDDEGDVAIPQRLKRT